MFTIEQIKAAHSKVKTGADFPAYIHDLKTLGVTYYETFVTDGHTIYAGANGYKTTAAPRHHALEISGRENRELFMAGLQDHQQGKTDYHTFISLCAATGIEKWAVCLEKMTCTYYSQAGNEILSEQIPE